MSSKKCRRKGIKVGLKLKVSNRHFYKNDLGLSNKTRDRSLTSLWEGEGSNLGSTPGDNKRREKTSPTAAMSDERHQ